MSRRIRTGLQALVVLAATTVSMAQDGRVVAVVTGATQGAIDGSSTFAQALDSVDVLEYHHLMLRPQIEPPEHKEVIFTKNADRATVNLWRAYDTDESLTVRFDHWLDCTGTWLLVHRVELTGAKIQAIEPVWESTEPLVTERVRLHYAQLELTNWRFNSGCTGTGPPESLTVEGQLSPP